MCSVGPRAVPAAVPFSSSAQAEPCLVYLLCAPHTAAADGWAQRGIVELPARDTAAVLLRLAEQRVEERRRRRPWRRLPTTGVCSGRACYHDTRGVRDWSECACCRIRWHALRLHRTQWHLPHFGSASANDTIIVVPRIFVHVFIHTPRCPGAGSTQSQSCQCRPFRHSAPPGAFPPPPSKRSSLTPSLQRVPRAGVADLKSRGRLSVW